MESNHRRERPDIDEFLYYKLLQARELPEGMLTTDCVEKYYGFTNNAQLGAWLKAYEKFPYQISIIEKVRPQFTKHEIIEDLKEEFFRLRRKYIFLKPPEPEWYL